ncbi:SDR family NAD(P)-dependent oxidoreductase [Bifidobacterium avesanii]|uniref:SDR family NAD(P)-dependent oxidoreductase n=1 Tax=Bifidobacterium avesanii TaxID=1798157 RepID=A0A7K3TIF6_9BIFI|nr:SDR family NAD(P)-dependent oxidoreductase [Bifidobacterium avesanii]KAB8292782.1 short-chain dehydrogenase [Bifidobacterium avesanii]NEG78390.1 SDR family NAD(P)-dependent oxidoreductase [Bifidobacterium avesanii]
MATALITGATGGIGRELALLAARDGFDLVLTARNEARLETLADAIGRRTRVRVTTVALDLAEPDAAALLHERTERLGIAVDVLANNAGFADWTGYLDADWVRQSAMMQVNMHALAELAYRYGRDMRKRGHGRILNIASVAATMPGPYMAMYFASKAFVRSLGEALSYELKGTGVTVTTVCPGPTTTGFEQVARMSGRNFFTMTRPASAASLARFAWRRTMRGSTLAYHGTTALAGALAERLLPRALNARIAAFMNGDDPSARR